MNGAILGFIVVIIVIVVIAIIGSATKNEVNIRRSVQADMKARAQFSSWANKMDSKVTGRMVLLWDMNKQGNYMIFPVWQEIRSVAENISINIYELIDGQCPKVKEHIDKLVAEDKYDAKQVAMDIVAFAIASFWVAGDSVGKHIAKSGIKSIVDSLKYDDSEAKKIMDEVEKTYNGMKSVVKNGKDDSKFFGDKLLRSIAGVKTTTASENAKYDMEISFTLTTGIGKVGAKSMEKIRQDDASIVASGRAKGLTNCSLFDFL